MSNSLRVFIVLLAIVFIGVLSTVLLVGGRKDTTLGDLALTDISVADYINNADSKVIWTEEGELVGDNERRAIRITVGPTERKAEILAGYDQKVIDTVKFSNTKKAYTSFLLALEEINFTKERKTNSVDERGICPFGSRYIYELVDDQTSKIRLWSDSCSADHGTYAGNAKFARSLFKAQVTDYKKFVSKVDL